MTNEHRDAVIQWRALAKESIKEARLGILLPRIALSRARLYRLTADSIIISDRLGYGVDSTTWKPIRQEQYHYIRVSELDQPA